MSDPEQRMAFSRRLLFPPKPRTFPGERWVNIALRCLHLVGIAGIGGGFLFDLEQSRWMAFWYLTLAPGVLLSLLYAWGSFLWFFQLKGLTIVLKLLLLAVALAVPSWRGEVFILVIALSGLIGQAPGQVRGIRPLPVGGPGRGSGCGG
jgi:hypothetical protein